jgi:hypothetical protein
MEELQAKLHAKQSGSQRPPSINSDQVSKRAGRRAEKQTSQNSYQTGEARPLVDV